MRIIDLKSECFALEELILQAENEIDEETGEFINNDDLIKELSDELKENKAGLLNYLVDKRDEYKLLEQGLNDKIKHLQGKKKTAQNQQRRIVDTIDYVLEGEKFKS
jgi:chromosome segregation ATPase